MGCFRLLSQEQGREGGYELGSEARLGAENRLSDLTMFIKKYIFFFC